MLDFVEVDYTKLFITAALSTMKIVELNASRSTDEDSPGKPMIVTESETKYSCTATKRLTLQSRPKILLIPFLYGVPRALARGGASVSNVSKASPDWTLMSSFLAFKTLPYLVISLIRSLHSNEALNTYTNAASSLFNGYHITTILM